MLFKRLNTRSSVSPPTGLAGRKVWVPRMSAGSARAVAAVFRSLGLDAECTPASDERTRELGARHTCGDECYPTKVTLGDFLKILEQPGADPHKTAFFMPTSQGPCRFGQYTPHLKSVLMSLGYSGAAIVAPDCDNGYDGFGKSSTAFVRGLWRALVAGDILLKLLYRTRPYENASGRADAVYENCIAGLCRVMETPYPGPGEQMEALRAVLLRCRALFRGLPVRRDDRLLIGVVGEIFCRLNTFSNDDLVRRLEAFGAEIWMNDISEWIWYTNWEQAQSLRLRGRTISGEGLSALVRRRLQKRDEHEMVSLFQEDFFGQEEPDDVQRVLDFATPYLPPPGCSGEMVLNAGKAVYFARKGVDGVIDISPFTCMNGIVCEAVYPRVSRDNAGLPIRNFYFDGTQSDLERDIGIYLELARNYRRHKPWPRIVAQPLVAAAC
jgi:predicted nucleotide-binding protein (sugar kinase/HSP70/actin superfamily)